MPTQADLALQALSGAQPAAAAPAAPTQADQALAAAGVPLAPPRTTMQQFGDFGSAAMHHLGNLPHGAVQLVENGVAKLFSLAPDNAISRYVTSTAASDNAAMNEREAAYQKDTPDGWPATLGATAGEVVPLVVGGIPKALGATGDYVASKIAPLLPSAAQKIGAKLISAGTQGAAVSAASPVTNPTSLADLVTGAQAPDYWSQKAGQVEMGAGLGAAIPAAAGGARAIYQGAKNVAAPITNTASVVAPGLEALLTRDGQVPVNDVLDALRNAPAHVEGSSPTTAQVLAQGLQGGNPQAVMAEKTVANTPAGKIVFADRDIANNAARIAQLKALAGTPDDLAAAIQARKDAAQPAIDKMLADPVQNPTVLKTSQPIRAGAITAKIDALANTSFGTDPVISKSLGAIRQQVMDAADKTDVNAYTYTPSQLQALKNEPYVRPDLLDGIRQNLRNTISDNASNGAVSSKQEAGLQPLADHITSAIDGANPGYRNYLATFAKASQPINSMEAAGGILADVAGAGRGANSAGDAQVTLPAVRSALARALKNSPYELDPQTQAALEGVQADLQRSSISNSVRTPGSDTSFNLQAPGWLAGKVYGADMTGDAKGAKMLAAALGGLGGMITHGPIAAAGGATAGGAAATKITSMGQQRAAAMLAKALAEPEYAADLLQQAQQAKTALPPPGVSARIPQMNLLLGQVLGQRNP